MPKGFLVVDIPSLEKVDVLDAWTSKTLGSFGYDYLERLIDCPDPIREKEAYAAWECWNGVKDFTGG